MAERSPSRCERLRTQNVLRALAREADRLADLGDDELCTMDAKRLTCLFAESIMILQLLRVGTFVAFPVEK